MKGIDKSLDDPYLSVNEGLTTDTSVTTDQEADFSAGRGVGESADAGAKKTQEQTAGGIQSSDEEGGVQSSDNEDESSKAADVQLQFNNKEVFKDEKSRDI